MAIDMKNDHDKQMNLIAAELKATRESFNWRENQNKQVSEIGMSKIRDLINGMYNDHVKYPQLKLPEMQAARLNELLTLVR